MHLISFKMFCQVLHNECGMVHPPKNHLPTELTCHFPFLQARKGVFVLYRVSIIFFLQTQSKKETTMNMKKPKKDRNKSKKCAI